MARYACRATCRFAGAAVGGHGGQNRQLGSRGGNVFHVRNQADLPLPWAGCRAAAAVSARDASSST